MDCWLWDQTSHTTGKRSQPCSTHPRGALEGRRSSVAAAGRGCHQSVPPPPPASRAARARRSGSGTRAASRATRASPTRGRSTGSSLAPRRSTAHAKLLSVCDLCNGYWNVSLDEQSKRLTAWGSEQSQWVWRCLPQGMVSIAGLSKEKVCSLTAMLCHAAVTFASDKSN